MLRTTTLPVLSSALKYTDESGITQTLLKREKIKYKIKKKKREGGEREKGSGSDIPIAQCCKAF